MQTLHDSLLSYNVEDLKSRSRLLTIKAPSTRKADLIVAIQDHLTGQSLRDLWHSLSLLGQQAVAEACYAPDLTLHSSQFAAKYGEPPPFFIPRKDQDKQRYGSWDRGEPSTLTTLFFSRSYRSQTSIPHDLAENLRKFVPKPKPLKIEPLPNPPDEKSLTTRHTEQEAINDVVTLLRLAEQGSLRSTAKTGMPTAAGKKAMLECLTGGDFYPPEIAYLPSKKNWEQEIGPIKLVGWTRLLQTSGYLKPPGAKSSLTSAGIKALSKPRHEIIRHLWNKWLTNNQFDEFNRIDVIKGQKAKGHMTAKPARRMAIVNALQECPIGEWIDTQVFSSFMQAQKFDFEITKVPYKLYICDPEYGHFDYDGYGGWNMLQFRYLLALLFEYAAPLGFVDLAFTHPDEGPADYGDQWGTDDLRWLSRYDGLKAFRITDLGAYCLGLAETFKETQPKTSLRLKLSPDQSISLISNRIQPSETLLLETWAEPIAAGKWHLDPLRARDAIERGNSTEDFLTFLQKCDDQPVPETIEGFLKTALRNGQALKNAGEARLFDCSDRKTTDMILEHKNLKALCSRCGETQLVVPKEHVQKFQKLIRTLGLGFH